MGILTFGILTFGRLRTVTAITRQDGEEFLRLAARYQVKAETSAYPRSDANHRLVRPRAGWVSRAAVLRRLISLAPP